MLKKTIKWINPFTNEEEEDTFYFNITKAELVEMELATEGGLSESLKKVVASEDAGKIIAEFKKIILSAYGVRSEDGRFFKKTQELRDEFESSEAYSTLFIEILTDTDSAIEFVKAIVPADMADEVDEAVEQEDRPELAVVPEVRTEPSTVVPDPEFEPKAQDDETGKGDN